MRESGIPPVSKGRCTVVRETRIVIRTLNPERRKLDFFTRRSPRPRNRRISKGSYLVTLCESTGEAYMSYENRCANRAVDRWILMPPKKNKLWIRNEWENRGKSPVRQSSTFPVHNPRNDNRRTRKVSISNSQTSRRRNFVGPIDTPEACTPRCRLLGIRRCKPEESRNYANRIDQAEGRDQAGGSWALSQQWQLQFHLKVELNELSQPWFWRSWEAHKGEKAATPVESMAFVARWADKYPTRRKTPYSTAIRSEKKTHNTRTYLFEADRKRVRGKEVGDKRTKSSRKGAHVQDIIPIL